MPKVVRHMSDRSRRMAVQTASPLYLILSAVVLIASLGAVLRVNAMPVEARQQQIWYAYRHDLNYTFTARVKPGGIYPTTVVAAADLLKIREPVDPPAFRRVLLGRLTDSITVKLPYVFVADRPSEIRAKYWVEGTLSTSNLWQRPYPLMDPKEVTVSSTELRLDDFAVEIPVQQIIAEMRKLTKELEIIFDPVELRIRPIVKIEVTGQKDRIQTSMMPEITLQIRGGDMAVELDDPKVTTDEKTFSETLIIPNTISVLGKEFRVGEVRQFALTALSIFATLAALVMVVQWFRRRAVVGDDLKRLGSAVITAHGFEMPDDATVVEIRGVQQLVALHLQTDRPIIRVGETCYLLDGSTCYRMRLREATGSD